MGRCATCRASTQNFCFVHQEFVCSTCLIHHPTGLHATCPIGTYRDFVQDSSYPPVPLCASCKQPFRSPSEAVRRLCLHLECVACITIPARKPDITCATCAVPLLPPDAPPSALQEAIRARFLPAPIHIALQPDPSAHAPPPPPPQLHQPQFKTQPQSQPKSQPQIYPYTKPAMRALPTSPVAATPSPEPIQHTASMPLDYLAPSAPPVRPAPHVSLAHPQMSTPTSLTPTPQTVSTMGGSTSVIMLEQPQQHQPQQTILHSRPPPQIIPFRVAGSGFGLADGKSGSGELHASPRRGSRDMLVSPRTTKSTATETLALTTASLLSAATTVAMLLTQAFARAQRTTDAVRQTAVPQVQAQILRMQAQVVRVTEGVERMVRRLGKEVARRLRIARKSPVHGLRARRCVVSAMFVVSVILLILLSSGDDGKPSPRHAQKHLERKRVPTGAVDAATIPASYAHANNQRKHMLTKHAARFAVRHHAENDEEEVVRLPNVHVGRAFHERPAPRAGRN